MLDLRQSHVGLKCPKRDQHKVRPRRLASIGVEPVHRLSTLALTLGFPFSLLSPLFLRLGLHNNLESTKELRILIIDATRLWKVSPVHVATE